MTSFDESTTVKERPILFSAPMVRAILDGRKSMTRRIIKPQPETMHEGKPYWHIGGLRTSWIGRTEPHWGNNPLMCPYGTIGERLWVRETFCRSRNNTFYKADYPGFGKPNELSDSWDWDSGGGQRWTPSVHMNRRYSRITLEITGVRVERLNEISEEDAKAEGVVFDTGKPGECRTCAKGAFMDLWNSINGTDSWLNNPWVWVVEFKKVAQ